MTKHRESFHLRPEGEKAFAYAQAVRVGDTLHLSGSLAVDDGFAPVSEGDMEGQLRAVYATMKRTLEAHGVGMEAMVKETVFVTDMDALLGANHVRGEAYAGHDLPACTVVQIARLAFPANLVEIEGVATLANAKT